MTFPLHSLHINTTRTQTSEDSPCGESRGQLSRLKNRGEMERMESLHSTPASPPLLLPPANAMQAFTLLLSFFKKGDKKIKMSSSSGCVITRRGLIANTRGAKGEALLSEWAEKKQPTQKQHMKYGNGPEYVWDFRWRTLFYIFTMFKTHLTGYKEKKQSCTVRLQRVVLIHLTQIIALYLKSSLFCSFVMLTVWEWFGPRNRIRNTTQTFTNTHTYAQC